MKHVWMICLLLAAIPMALVAQGPGTTTMTTVRLVGDMNTSSEVPPVNGAQGSGAAEVIINLTRNAPSDANPNALFRSLNDFPFAQQNFTQGHFAWPSFVPDIAPPLGEFLEFGNGKTLAPRPAQCLLPQLTFQHDRVSVEQMFLRPLNRFTNTDAPFFFRVMLRLF
jgi:hypothetical protein